MTNKQSIDKKIQLQILNDRLNTPKLTKKITQDGWCPRCRGELKNDYEITQNLCINCEDSQRK